MRNRGVLCRARSLLSAVSVAFPCVALGLVGSPAFGQESQFGKWDPPPAGQRDKDPNDGGDYGWELITYTAALLSTGKVLVWEQFAPPKLWNPTDGLFTGAPCDCAVLYCSGHSFLKDGSLLVAGGLGTTQTRIFRPTDPGGWEVVNPMAHTRFYPTCTTLPDGRVLTVAGSGSGTEIPEIYDPETGMWDELTNPEAKTTGIAKEYPFMFLLPDGMVFHAGGSDAISPPAVKTHTLDFQSTPPAWAEFPELNNDSFFGGRKGAAVMYEPGKILKAGGVDPSGQPISKVAKIDIDSNGSTTGWELLPPSSSLPEARKDHHLVLLPDGKILLVGGHDGTNYIKDARMFDPNAVILEWVDMADMVKARGHHAVALLLPDATVLSAGGPGSLDPATAEIYRPPYLFAGPRPVIGPAPSSVQYGCQFLVTATPIEDIDRVTLVRPAAVTHWFDQDQRFLELTFTVVSDELLVDAPANANLAPPGYYMLFVIDNTGVPSVAKWIQFPNDCPADLDGDGDVDAADLAILLGAWGPNPGHPADLSCDGVVEAFDLAILLGAWGVCSGRGISSGTELINALVEMGYANVAEHTAWSMAAPTEDALASGQQLLELLGE